MQMPISRNSHTFTSLNPAHFAKLAKRFPTFLGILDVYKQLIYYEKPKLFKVEPKYGKEFMEPDAFTIWRRSPFFIEVRSQFTAKKLCKIK